MHCVILAKRKAFFFLEQHAKKVMSESSELVDFAIGLVNALLNLPDKQVKFFTEFKLQKNNCNHSYSSKNSFGLVLASYNLPKVQAVKLTFSAPCGVTISFSFFLFFKFNP